VFDRLDLDVKDVVEMLLENLLMFPGHLQLHNLATEERNVDNHAQDPAAMLQAAQVTDKSETTKPQIPPGM
jgi:hypothetical protein